MGKVRDLSNRVSARRQPTPQGEPILHRHTAEALVEAQILLFIGAALKILVKDFDFDKEKLQKFQELWFAQTELDRLHRK